MSSINNIGGSIEGIKKYSFIDSGLTPKEVKPASGFGDFFDAAVNLLNETSKYEIDAEKIQLDYITGRTDDMAAVLLAEQKAYTALSFTVQITNKIIDSYKQIMTMQV